MCMWCGQLYCPTDCPGYVPEHDPWFTGYCRECGVPLYEDGVALCETCREAEADDTA